ncbi:MAG: lytic transglycosylase domain-containing protein, partial [Polynucleobacter sp.]|nr:lytic transglycosylase domain-containing protein [Polynucleobacter sp.]
MKIRIAIHHFLAMSLIFALLIGMKQARAEKIEAYKEPDSKILAIEITPADKLFIELREAAKRNDTFRAQQLAANLSAYPYQDYVTYFRLKTQIYDSGNNVRADIHIDSQIVSFLKEYQGSAIADRLRNDWLLVLGKRKDWESFDAEYARFVLDDDTQVKCYALMSRLAKLDPKL